MKKLLRPLKRRIMRLKRLIDVLGFWPGLRFHFRTRLGSKLIQIAPPGMDRALYLRAGSSDALVFEDIFFQHQYDVPVDFDPRVIIDAGANVGYAAAYFAHRFPKARVVAIEPEASNLELLRRNAALFGNVEIIEGGLWGQDGRLGITNPDADKWAIQIGDPGNGTGAIAALSVETLMARLGVDRIDIFKIDIEGGELNLFSSPNVRLWLPKVRRMVIELHDRAGFPPGINRVFDSALAGYPHLRQRHGEDTIIDFPGVPTC